MLRLRYVALASVLGCSPIKDASNVPDASIDSMDDHPPAVLSSNPANMGTKVSVIQPISVFFDEPLDAASVSAATVKLGYDQSVPPLVFPAFNIALNFGPVPATLTRVKGTVSYDEAARKVSFVPAAPLPYGYNFTLALDVKDTAGLATTTKIQFTTFINSNTKQFNFNTNGAPVSWMGQPLDMNGRVAKRIGGGSVGIDGVWFTADDPKNQRYDYNYAPDGRIIDERYYSSGPDAIWDNADDTISICVKYVYDAQGVLKERNYPQAIGPDNMWCTADDVPTYNAVFEYMDAKLTGWVLNSTAGPDAAWHTADDRCVVYFDHVFDAMGNKTRDIYRVCGPDQLPRTADDTFQYYYDFEYNADGLLTKQAWRTGPGPDGIWLTTDDLYNFVERLVRNADGVVTDTIRTNGPGADAMWGTVDDTPGFRTSNTLNANKLPEEITTYSTFGADMMWGTPDDVVSGYSKLTYDGLGNRTDQKFFFIGADNVWKTADDKVSQDWDFDVTR